MRDNSTHKIITSLALNDTDVMFLQHTFFYPLSLLSSLIKLNLPLLLFLSVSAGGFSKLFAVTCAVALHLDKMTAGPFSRGLYLLLLQGKCFRAWQLRTSTIYYHKETERKKNKEEEKPGKVFVWVEQDRSVCLFETDNVCVQGQVFASQKQS